MHNAIVTAINLFPVRSCAGISLNEAKVTPNGFEFDRQWRLVTPAGKFITQNNVPKMALVKPALTGSTLNLSFAGSSSCLTVRGDNGTLSPVQVSDGCLGFDQGDEVAHWLSTVLGAETRLLRLRSESSSVDFVRPNMYPVLIISQESLADLNSRLESPVFMNRFRPNLVVSGVDAYEEESWTKVWIGGILFEQATDPCGRCPMINIDQEKGERSGKEPLTTLINYRRMPGAVVFGKYMVPLSDGVIRVNDKISAAMF